METTDSLLQQEPTQDKEWAWIEVHGAKLPDVRFKKSLAAICQKIHQQPGVSFSRACEAKRKAGYRLVNIAEITPQDILVGHSKQTRERAKEYSFFLAASDTTSFDFTSHKACTGLGPIASTPKSQGFLTHSVIALSPKGVPLGVLYQQSWTRTAESFGQSNQRRSRPESEKESQKWVKALRGVEEILQPEDSVLLIQDREADIVSFLQEPRRENTYLLIRSCHPRKISVKNDGNTKLEDGNANLWEAARCSPVVAKNTLSVKVKKGKEFTDRCAQLSIRYTHVEIIPPVYADKSKPNPVVWVVCAREDNPPPGFDAIEWILLSTFPVTDSKTALDMVLFYTYRWLIERFHYVLKSGLGVENLQLDDVDSLMKYLSFYSIVGWRLLYLTYLAREAPNTPANYVFTDLSIKVLSAHSGKTISSVSDAVMAVARVGGFRPCRSAPRAGVKSLWMGLRRLDGMEEGWQMAFSAMSALSAKDMGQD
ncbi:IS4 family transposase [Armatimonas sp.]|uniref:IS4 family transposase n=1 Tax=Armatimonas sp. TaxID=1872638 RepID=UPI00286B9AC7|nr:IS4 family transposase [Armatimonas sp.]